jgi:hypothetical protein
MKMFLIALIFFCHVALGESIQGEIYSVDIGQGREDHLLKLESGRVIFIKSEFHPDEKLKRNIVFDFLVDKKNYLLKFKPFRDIKKIRESKQSIGFIPKPFEPTILKDNLQAKNIFLRMRRNYTQGGQCFNRAHVWTYEEFKKNKNKLHKIFIFFTNRYIRLYRFHWWFHVSPLTYVGTSARVLDRRYGLGPLTMKTWTDIFIKSKRSCLLVDRYSDYSNYQESQHCYLFKSSMYQLIPRDLEKLELYGEGKEYFFKNELDKAYRDAFLSRPN